MNILFDMGHPAHFHLFKNFIKYLKTEGHVVTIVTRDKDINISLLDNSGFEYSTLTKAKTGTLGLGYELLMRDYKVWRLHMKHKFQMGFGTSVSIAHLSAITGHKSFVFSEDDDDIVPLYANLTYPFATKILVPHGLRGGLCKKKRVYHNSLHELAYLHPNNFQPSLDVIKKYNLEPYKYVLIRNSALTAHHDDNAQGINQDLWNDIAALLKDYKIVQSKENNKSHQIKPWDMHHVLAFAKMIISDSQSMTMEAANLGVPSIRYNTFVGRITCMEELENKYELTYGFKPGQESAMIQKVKEFLVQDTRAVWSEKLNRLLSDKEDFNAWLIKFFEEQRSNIA